MKLFNLLLINDVLMGFNVWVSSPYNLIDFPFAANSVPWPVPQDFGKMPNEPYYVKLLDGVTALNIQPGNEMRLA
jgi:hypothetical protein